LGIVSDGAQRIPWRQSDTLAVFAVLASAVVVLAFSGSTVSLDDVKVPLLMILGSFAGLWTLLSRLPEYDAMDRAFAVHVATFGMAGLFATRWWPVSHELALMAGAWGLYLAFAQGGIYFWGRKIVWRGAMLTGTVALGFAWWHYAQGADAALMSMVDRDGKPYPEWEGNAWYLLIGTLADAEEMLGPFLNTDFFAGYTAFMAPLALGFAMSEYGPWRSLGIALCVLAAVATLVTLSKESVAALFGGMTVTALVWRGTRPWLDILRRWAIPAVVIAILSLFATWSRIGPELKTLPMAFAGRFALWEGAIGVWSDAPLFGAGPGNFRIEFTEHRRPDYFLVEINNVTTFSHSLYFDVLSETGLIGFAGWLFFLAVWWRAARIAMIWDGPEERWLVAGLLGAFVAASIQNVSSPWTRWPVGVCSWWVLLGLGVGTFRSIIASGETRWPTKRLPVGASWAIVGVYAALVVFSIVVGTRYIRAQRTYADAYRLHARGDTSGAVAGYERALELLPRLGPAAYRLGALYHQEGLRRRTDGEEWTQKAIAQYEDISSWWPNYAELPYNLSLVYDAMSMHTLRRSADNLTEALTWKNKSVEAAEAFTKIAVKGEAYRGLAQAYEGRRRVFVALNRDEEAIADAERAALSWELAAQAWTIQDGREGGEHAADIKEAKESHLVALQQSGQADLAAALAEAMYRAAPDDDMAATQWTETLLLDVADSRAAWKAAREALRDQPLSPVRWWNMTRAALLTLRDADAAKGMKVIDVLAATGTSHPDARTYQLEAESLREKLANLDSTSSALETAP